MSELNFNNYTEGEGASHALVGDLTKRVITSASEPLFEGDGWAVFATGEEVTWFEHLERPVRRRGRTELRDPRSFGEYVHRLATDDTTVWADKAAGRLVAVFNDHPATDDVTVAPSAGHRDDKAVLELVSHEDWREWSGHNNKLMSQRDFGEFIEAQAHTIVRPSSAEMLEVATTLTAKRNIDFSSRTRLDNGDVAFKFEEETTMRAGRAAEVEIPSTFRIAVPVWEGTEPVEIEARLRVRGGPQGVTMGYKLIQVSAAVDTAFDAVRELVAGELPNDMPIFVGTV